ncbi:3-keto-disaccharide hydrolase [Flagellimonas meishanensis]|uniref:3-keto-disaccharide hydrolase n=1 Tax=Flagellimonas meishanensis TaxID=2873264 RepID=UPI001CA6552E|nr:DUF1080 domain-containing protein [[Muricauda] meishanensis]
MKAKIYCCLILVLCSISCKKDKKDSVNWHTKKEAEKNATHNTLLDVERELGWELLFDGKTLNGWHLFNNPGAASVWKVENGTLYCAAKEEGLAHGDLVTNESFENYELALEWRISGRGNSGVFINVQEAPKFSAAWQTGPEYQILDPEHMDYRVETKKTGCLYGFLPQLNEAVTKTKGQWNQTKIIQNNGKVEFYLNGTMTALTDFNSKEWKKMISDSGFKDREGFGQAVKGKIALQDWYFEAWFRNIKIRPLKTQPIVSENSL